MKCKDTDTVFFSSLPKNDFLWPAWKCKRIRAVAALANYRVLFISCIEVWSEKNILSDFVSDICLFCFNFILHQARSDSALFPHIAWEMKSDLGFRLCWIHQTFYISVFIKSLVIPLELPLWTNSVLSTKYQEIPICKIMTMILI